MLSRRNFLTMGMAQEQPTTILPQSTTALEMTPELHLLNRITYGPRPEEVEHIYKVGYEGFLEEQLNPDSIDDSVCDKLIKELPVLAMDRQTAYKLPQSYGRAHDALVKGMITRAVHSRRQLFERTFEFWTDHFNIPADDYSVDLLEMHNTAIRRNTFGKFQMMLIEVTKAPAMLYYLNNSESYKEIPNENYARELLELYTMGVDGGYSEKDVKEAAKALTGWTTWDGTDSGFYFDMERHDVGEKTILGHKLPADRGIDDGYHLLNIVTHHPSTARFLATKLCRRFVADQPVPSIVDSTAKVWMENNGQIKPVLRHIFLSDEFKAAVGQKFRRPFDFYIGALRATGTEVKHMWQMMGILEDLGQVPFGWKPPNGYPDAAGAWLATGGLLARWNVAMRLTHSAYSQVGEDEGWALKTELRERIGEPQNAGQLVDAVGRQVFGTNVSNAIREFYVKFVTDDAGNADSPISLRLLGRKLGTLYGLMLASPQFQWR